MTQEVDFEKVMQAIKEDVQSKLEANSENAKVTIKASKNELSYWYPRIQAAGYKTPDTVTIPLDESQIEWLHSDDYKEDAIKAFSDAIKAKLMATGFNTDRRMFIKTGLFSHKFNFNESCDLPDIDEIGEHFLQCHYGGWCMGCDSSGEVVVREFIETKYERASIYDGMKLNTEFRVFYDFDKNTVLGVFNYWDRDVMVESLSRTQAYNNNYQTFLSEIDAIEKDFEVLSPLLKKHIEHSCIAECEFEGIWSLDFMWDGDIFWLIDMALGQNSYYYDRVR